MKALSRITASVCSMIIFASSVSCSQQTVIKKQAEQVEISFSWWGNDARHKYTLEAIEEFEEKYPNIKVNCSYSEWSGYETRSRVQMISDTEADVMQINYGWLSEYSEDGLGYYDINELTDYFDITNFSDDFLKYGRKAKHQNAIPIAMNAQTVYINKTMYDRYGLDVPKTWDDLFKSAEVMREYGVYPLSAASKALWLYAITYAEQATGKTILTNGGGLNFNAEDFQVMFDFYKKLVDEKVLPQVEYYERINLEDELYAGAVAWVSDAVNYFGKAVENGREIVIADYTTFDGTNTGQGWYAKPATMYAISKNTSHPRESAILLDFLMNSSDMSKLQGLEKGVPLSSSAQQSLEKYNMLSGIQYDASKKMEESSVSELNPILENGDMIDDFFYYANEIIYGKSESEEASKQFYSKIKKEHFS